MNVWLSIFESIFFTSQWNRKHESKSAFEDTTRCSEIVVVNKYIKSFLDTSQGVLSNLQNRQTVSAPLQLYIWLSKS